MTTIVCLIGVAVIIALGVYLRPSKAPKPKLPPIDYNGYD